MNEAAPMIETKQVTITNRTAAVIGRMGLAFPAGSEERAAATLLLGKFAHAPAIVRDEVAA